MDKRTQIHDECGDMSIAMTTTNRIREWRERKGLSQEALGELSGMTGAQISRLENAKRRLKTEDLRRIAVALGVPWQELLGDLQLPALQRRRLSSVMVRGRVEAGVWQESVEWPPEDWYPITVPETDEFSGVEKYAVEIRGRSMDKIFPDGSIAICVPIYAFNREIPSGAVVHVQRSRIDGGFESTLKEYVVEPDGRIYLWPRSTDPDHQAPIRYDDRADAVVQIRGIVVGDYRPANWLKPSIPKR